MARTKHKTETKTYYQAVQEIFAKQSEILTAVLPHYGERGRNDEERLRDLLIKVLPRRFSIGTGFIVCHDTNIPHSSQTDIVIYDETQNSPLHRELSAYIYPIEIVYGAIEVKGNLRRQDISKALKDIQKIRQLAKYKWYVNFTSKPKKPEKPEQLIVVPEDFQKILSPRTYLFAYDAGDWKTINTFVKYLKEQLLKNKKAFLHGAIVLSKNWFVYQEAFEEDVVLKQHADNALLRFMHKLTYDLSSIKMHSMSLDKYCGVSYGAS